MALDFPGITADFLPYTRQRTASSAIKKPFIIYSRFLGSCPDQGTKARENSELFVRGTVLLATILFLIAIALRFRIHSAREGWLVVAAAMIVYVLTNVAHYPKL